MNGGGVVMVRTMSFQSQNRTCSSTEFHCGNGVCVPAMWKCDGDNDCGDYSDESRATCAGKFACQNYTFACGNGKCVNKLDRCDGVDDCGDHSDEDHCNFTTPHHVHTTPSTNCDANYQFKCVNSGACIPLFWRCDGSDDCGDSSDEAECEARSTMAPCPGGQFRCDTGTCIAASHRCNGVNDCLDWSDEAYMECYGGGGTTSSATTPPSKGCSGNQFQCRREDTRTRDVCIFQSWVCDGARDCPLGDDEESCTDTDQGCDKSGEIRCLLSSGCVALSAFCDGKVDCADGLDEMFCNETSLPPPGTTPGTPCGPGMSLCNDGEKCFPNVYWCNNITDCSDGSDEEQSFCSAKNGTMYVRSVTFDTASNHSLTLRWRSPAWLGSRHVKVTYIPRITIEPSGLKKSAYGLGYDVSNISNWKDGEETNNTWAVFDNLLPYTTYIGQVAVVAHLGGKKHRSEPLTTVSGRTRSGCPSAPQHTTVAKLNGSDSSIVISWKPPQTPNGPVNKYTVRVYQVSPKDSLVDTLVRSHRVVQHGDRTTNSIVIRDLAPWYKYRVLVEAVTWSSCVSPPSNFAVIDLTKDVLQPVTDLTAESWSDETKLQYSCTLKWKASPSATQYEVQYQVDSPGDQTDGQTWLKNVTKDTSFKVSGLVPDTKYTWEVRPQQTSPDLHSVTTGPFTTVTFRTLQPPSTVPYSTNINNLRAVDVGDGVVRVTWQPPPSPAAVTWTYGVYYGTGPDELRAPRLTTTSSNVTVSGLVACSDYIYRVRVIKPFHGTPSINIQNRTAPDVLSAPTIKGVTCNTTHCVLRWTPPCSDNFNDTLPLKLGYTVQMVMVGDENDDSNTTKTSTLQATNSLSPSATFYPVERGATYVFRVSTSQPGSRWSKQSTMSTVKIQPILPPTGVHAIAVQNGSLYVNWEENREKECGTAACEYYVWVTRHEDHQAPPLTFKEMSPPVFITDSRLTSNIYDVQVSVGRHGQRSAEQSLHYTARNAGGGGAAVPKSSVVVGVAVAAGVLIVCLAAALLVFVVRHRRLQTSFLSFAASHYNVNSGRTTFSASSDDLGAEEESPVIQGFADDEPLVIA